MCFAPDQYIAVLMLSEVLIRMLIRKGASVNAVDPVDGAPVLHHVFGRVAEDTCLNVTTILAEHGYDFSAKDRRDGWTALDKAIDLGFVELARMLAGSVIDPASKHEEAVLPSWHDFVQNPKSVAAREFCALFRRRNNSASSMSKRLKK